MTLFRTTISCWLVVGLVFDLAFASAKGGNPFCLSFDVSARNESFAAQALSPSRDYTHPAISPEHAATLSRQVAAQNLITPLPDAFYSPHVEIRPLPESNWQLIGLMAREWQNRCSWEPLSTFRPLIGGMYSWVYQIHAQSRDFALDIPRYTDPPDVRTKWFDAVRTSYQASKRFYKNNLSRHLSEPAGLFEIPFENMTIPFLVTQFYNDYSSVEFSQGQLRIYDSSKRRYISLSHVNRANFLVELVAMLVYHLEVKGSEYSTLTDFDLNSGDALFYPEVTDPLDLKLIMIRRELKNIDPNHYLYSLIHLTTLESMWPDKDRFSAYKKLEVVMPIRWSNPSIAFAALERGLQRQYQDSQIPNSMQRAREDVITFLRRFADSDWGQSYGEAVAQYLAGNLPPQFGDDPLEGQPPMDLLETTLEQVQQDAIALGRGEQKTRSQYNTVIASMQARLKSQKTRHPFVRTVYRSS